MKKRRSWLIAPASRAARIEEAAQSGADVVVLDLIEFVADKDKAAARSAFAGSIEAAREGGAEVFAQIDPEAAAADLDACVRPGLAGVIVARAGAPGQMEAIAGALARLERERGMAEGSVEIVAALETAQGNHAGYDVASASPRVFGVTLGRADLVMDLRPEPSGEIHLMPYLMQRLVVIAGAAGVTPIGAWWREPDRGLLATPENTFEAARRGAAIGFKGAMCIKADQVDALNRGFAAVRAASVRPGRGGSGVEGGTA